MELFDKYGLFNESGSKIYKEILDCFDIEKFEKIVKDSDLNPREIQILSFTIFNSLIIDAYVLKSEQIRLRALDESF